MIAPEFLVYVGVPAIIVIAKVLEMRFDRRTKLLVEQERARSMLTLKESQQKEREDSFTKQKALISEAATRLRAKPHSEPKAETSTPVVTDAAPVADEVPVHPIAVESFVAPVAVSAPAVVEHASLSVDCRDEESSEDSVYVGNAERDTVH